jgi:hypothetical protein
MQRLNLLTTTQDRGATAVLVAFSMILLMAFAAVAIDYGLGVNERRLDQNTVDTATIAGGVELIVSGDLQNMVDSIKTYVNNNLDRIVTDTDWTNCVDSGALQFPTNTIPGIVNGSQCISLGESDDGIQGGRLRVRVPEQTTDAVFSRILGVVGLVTDAVAEIQLEDTVASGAFPAAVFSGAGAGDFFCIKTGTSGQASCGAPSTGDFGNFQPYFYTELAPGNPNTLCTSGNQVAPLSRSIADGIDHFLGVSPNPVGTKRNGANCPGFPGPFFPDRVDSGGGNSPTDITDGLVKGGNYDGAFTGRLTRKIWPSGTYGTATIFGNQIDNRPLWSYIDTNVLDAAAADTTTPPPPAVCYAAAAGPVNHSDSTDLVAEAMFTQAQADLVACLSHADTPSSVLHEDLYESPRLTIVPRYWESTALASNACCYNIKAFVPVFIDGIWTAEGPMWTCNNGMIRDTVEGFCKHEPGRSGTIHINAAGQQKISSAGAYVLNCELLPGVEDPAEKCKKVGVGGSTVDIFVNLELVK